jgi:hypothetical protein
MQLPVPVQVSFRQVVADKSGNPGKGHVMVNKLAICGEPVVKAKFITVDEFAADPCGKCRNLIDKQAKA